MYIGFNLEISSMGQNNKVKNNGGVGQWLEGP